MVLLPVKGGLDNDDVTDWRIWVLSTTLENLDLQQENEELLRSPTRQLNCCDDFQADVFIIGGENFTKGWPC